MSPNYPPEGQAQKVVGYRVTNEVRVTVRDFAKAGGILDKVIAAGANQVNGISFDLSDRIGPADEALKAAVADASRKASLMADAAGLKIVRMLSLIAREPGGRPIQYAAAPVMALARTATPVAPGEQQITANVTAVFEVAPK